MRVVQIRVDMLLSARYTDYMKSAALNQLVASALTTPIETVTVYARLLREAGLLTTGARGRHAPEMTPLDAARLVLAILTTNSPAQCVERVRRFGTIPYSPNFKRIYRGYEAMQPEQFSTIFEGETLEEVLAYIIARPSALGVVAGGGWLQENHFHLRVSDFDVVAELFKWKWDDGEIVGELVVPFRGAVMVPGEDGFRHVDNFSVIKGGVRTERSTSATNLYFIGAGLASESN
jgi:hypothetical protein